MGNSGKGLGIIALIIAIGALFLGVWQIIIPTPSTQPRIYSDTNNNTFYLNLNADRLIPNLNVSYTASAGDSVLLEFCCQVSIEIMGTTTIELYFEIDGSPPSPYAEMSVIGQSPNTVLHAPFTMKYNIESNSSGTHIVKIMTYIDDAGTTSFLRNCVLTATVY